MICFRMERKNCFTGFTVRCRDKCVNALLVAQSRFQAEHCRTRCRFLPASPSAGSSLGSVRDRQHCCHRHCRDMCAPETHVESRRNNFFSLTEYASFPAVRATMGTLSLVLMPVTRAAMSDSLIPNVDFHSNDVDLSESSPAKPPPQGGVDTE